MSKLLSPSHVQHEGKYKLTPITSQEELEALLAGHGRADFPQVVEVNGAHYCVASELTKWRNARG